MKKVQFVQNFLAQSEAGISLTRPREAWLHLIRKVEADLSGQMDFTCEEISDEARTVADACGKNDARKTGAKSKPRTARTCFKPINWIGVSKPSGKPTLC